MRRYRPVPLLRLLRDMMGYASISLDLAFYAVAFEDQSASFEVSQLERLVESMWEDAVVHATLAVRSVDEAMRMVSVFKVLDSLHRVTDTAEDFAALVIRGVEAPGVLRAALLSGAEVTAPMRLTESTRVAEIEERGVDVVAVKRGSEWILEPADDAVLHAGDLVLVRGSPDAVAAVTGLRPEVEEGGEVAEETLRLKKLADILLELGFYSIVYGDETIAHKVIEIEHRLDDDIISYYEMVSKLGLNPRQEYTLHKFAETVENVSDAAAVLAAMVKTHTPIHQVIEEAEDRAPETIIPLVYRGRPARIADTSLTKHELMVVAVRRGDRWVPTPPQDYTLRPGDLVIVKTYAENVEELLEYLKHRGFDVSLYED